VVVQAEPGTAMPTATVQYQADQAVVQPHQAMAAALQITDIETFQQLEHRDKDSQAVQAYDSTNKVRIYTLLVVVAELVDQVHVHQIIAMTEKLAMAAREWPLIYLDRYYTGAQAAEVPSITDSLAVQQAAA
jgi:hypothetical protein